MYACNGVRETVCVYTHHAEVWMRHPMSFIYVCICVNQCTYTYVFMWLRHRLSVHILHESEEHIDEKPVSIV